MNQFGEHLLKQLTELTCWGSLSTEEKGGNKESSL